LISVSTVAFKEKKTKNNSSLLVRLHKFLGGHGDGVGTQLGNNRGVRVQLMLDGLHIAHFGALLVRGSTPQGQFHIQVTASADP
jgi:hypothetical protein